jgi:hypothetical protein
MKAPGIRISNTYGDKEVKVFEREFLTKEAAYAFELIQKWGMILGIEDGEDSSGRAKNRPATPQEVVDRAFEVTDLFFTRAREKGFVIDLPDLNEINAVVKKEIA